MKHESDTEEGGKRRKNDTKEGGKPRMKMQPSQKLYNEKDIEQKNKDHKTIHTRGKRNAEGSQRSKTRDWEAS